MTIIQSTARLFRTPDDVLLGAGHCAIHVPEAARTGPVPISGTLLVEWLGDEQLVGPDDSGHLIELEDGRWLSVVITKHTAQDSGPEVLRFRGAGPFKRPEQRARPLV